MKKTLLILIGLMAFTFTVNAQVYKGKKTKVDFFSATAMEDISATDTLATTLLNTKDGQVIANIVIKGFVFPNALMQEHFNENYMESDKFPKASFVGNIQEKIDYTKDGTHNITMKGKLTVHGVEKERTLAGTLMIKGGMITVDVKFDIKLADHNIKVPEAVGQKIAETIAVTFHTEMAAMPAKAK
jgi:polyisoprenoid-binding protein YceI